MSEQERYVRYLSALKGNFTKVTKLEFLNPDGSVAFMIDNDIMNSRSKAFIQSGSLTCNLQNGVRRKATVTLANIDGEYEYAVNRIWFGTQIRLVEGLILPDGEEYLIPQGVFEILNPEEVLAPNERTVTYELEDKWVNLDGTLLGNLEGDYSVASGANIFTVMASVLKLGRTDMANNSSNPIDNVTPLFTNYYNDKTQTLTDGTTVSMTAMPYDLEVDDGKTLADVQKGLAEMLAAWVGYNQTGRFVVDPSQDDIEDATKPILWEFKMDEPNLEKVTYTAKNTEVYNDVIVVGATSDTNATARGRAQNLDPTSPTCVSRVGLKTKRYSMSNYYSDDICEAYAEWQLKRNAVLSKSVTITCSQMFHIVENGIVTIQRDDKEGSPVERHVVQSFTRPLSQTGTMSITAISVSDYPMATIITENQ